MVLIENITFNDCQRRVIWTRDLSNETVRNILITNSKKGHETFGGTDQLIYMEREGSTIAYVDTFSIEGVKSDGDTVVIGDPAFGTGGGTYTGASGTPIIFEETIFNHDPMYVDAANGDLRLMPGSPVATLGHDGGPLGDRNQAELVVSVENQVPIGSGGFCLRTKLPEPNFRAGNRIR